MPEINLNNLQKAREDKGYTLQEMAQKCGVSYVTYRKWEKGETKPNVVKAKKMANIFNTKIDILFFSRSFRII